MDVAFIFGTRPEITKSIGVARCTAQQEGVNVFGVCTGQQTGLVLDTIRDLELNRFIPIEWLSDRTKAGQDPEWISRAKAGLTSFLSSRRPAALIGTGDTNSVWVAAEMARDCNTSFVHLESGIRHPTTSLPSEPEEINRRRITKLTTLHLCPTARQRSHLLAEEIPNDQIHIVGDLSCAAIAEVWRIRRIRLASGQRGAEVGLPSMSGRICVCTFHRSTSMDNFDHFIGAFNELVCFFPEIQFVISSRPDTRWERFYSSARAAGNVSVLTALPPCAFQELLTTSDIVVTDSAGVQQEAILLNRPVLALRRNIELYAEDPLLCVVQPPYHNLTLEFTRMLEHAYQARELGVSHVNQTGNLVIERCGRMIRSFCEAAGSA